MTDKPPPEEPELRPDGWERFERAVDAALHTPPKHREGKKPVESKSDGKPAKPR
ncbi:MAG TPA: hypothetical protein VHZ26_13545 [Caulobacteraceae bacterium]|jgi:hypothetical protein|nr:hypothetical protein [Caulobacteraceae bacterium]